MRRLGVVLVVAGILGVAGCGSGGTTTVLKESAPTTVERTTTVKVPASSAVTAQITTPAPAPPSKPAAPPNVVGLPLPAGQQALKAAGYTPAVKNTDTAFGILVPSHFTICTEGKPRGKLVPILAQKYGC